MRILHLYRPRLPSLRAQAIQVVHNCHALAGLGHEVTLLADRGDGADPLTPFGLAPLDKLDLRVAPTAWHPGAGLWFRTRALRWWAGPPGLVIARDKRRLAQLLRWTGNSGTGTRRHRILLETHELDSAQQAEVGCDASDARALERWLLQRVDALVANCGGTLAMWEEVHGDLLPRARGVAHNAISPDRRRVPVTAPDEVIRCVGSLRAYKGVEALAEAARLLPLPVELVGGSADERAALGGIPDNVQLVPPQPYTAVPDLLARSRVLLLPLADNLFGRRLTSPLKLWDYLATSVPIVAPDLPTIDEIARLTGATLHRYQPGVPASLRRAVELALAEGVRTPVVRTWRQRALDELAVLEQVS